MVSLALRSRGHLSSLAISQQRPSSSLGTRPRHRARSAHRPRRRARQGRSQSRLQLAPALTRASRRFPLDPHPHTPDIRTPAHGQVIVAFEPHRTPTLGPVGGGVRHRRVRAPRAHPEPRADDADVLVHPPGVCPGRDKFGLEARVRGGGSTTVVVVVV